MYRARRHTLSLAGCTSPLVVLSRRQYTPIAQPDPAEDHVAKLRHADEVRTLWARDVPVNSIGRAVEMWLRMGNDPVVHTALRSLTAAASSDGKGGKKEGKKSASTSPFAHVEDYMGTNLIADRPDHVKASAELWNAFFDQKFLSRMRQSRRTSSNFVGQISAKYSYTDEADHPNTKWSADTHFSEMAYLSERHLKEKVTTPQQLEKALWEKADVEAFLAFFQSFQQQTDTRIPLPVPSVWVYEGEARKLWAEKYLPAHRAARDFCDNVLAADVKKAGSSPAAVCAAVATAFQKVHAVQLKRRERQVKAGLCPAVWETATSEQKNIWASNEVEAHQRSIQEDNYDPEDILDSTEEWAAEHAEIESLLSATVEGMSFSLKDFWTHMIRREELETAHILESEKMRDVAAAARIALYTETSSYAAVLEGVQQSLSRGSIDLRAAVFQPYASAVWCKLNYAKFGASSVYQHTTTASRQLLFHYAASPQEVAATATLYYASKPLSTRLDYASPYALRRSYGRLCAAYGLDLTHAAQRPLFVSAANIGKAEDLMGRIAVHVGHSYGEHRRAGVRAAQKANHRLLSPVSDVCVSQPVSELLPTGADDTLIEGTPYAKDKAAAAVKQVAMWPLGTKGVVTYKWPSPHQEKLTFVRQAGPLTAARATELQSIQKKTRLEISLWRKQPASELQASKSALEKESKEVEALVKAHPQLKQVEAYAARLYDRLSNNNKNSNSEKKSADNSGSTDGANDEWQFAVMLDDRATINEEMAHEVYLPYADAHGRPLPQGDYRLRVRAFDLDVNPECHPALCTEAFSPAFPVFDALPQLVTHFFEGKTSKPQEDDKEGANKNSAKGDDTVMAGSDLVAFCEYLREAGIDVPLYFEFDAGQRLDAKGAIHLDAFFARLRGTEFHQSLADNGFSETQQGIESQCRAHWSLYHPGANDAEWACARRGVLDAAMEKERDWWMPDSILKVDDIATSYINPASLPATVRYGTELCTVLTASGSTHEESNASFTPVGPGVVDKRLRADCTVDGTGAITRLTLGSGAALSAPDVTTNDALDAALTAIQRAQDRHCTLSMFKTGPMEKQSQLVNFCGIHGAEYGGKYARTYVYAAEKAKKELAETTAETGRAVLGVGDLERERVSDHEEVDRFASDSHPEQRLTRFSKRVNKSGMSMEDLGPDNTSVWGR